MIQILGFIGTIIVATAYIPQISHLIRKHCAYGINIKAWSLWLLATLLILPQAISSGNPVFITLQLINSVSITFILIFSYFHQDQVCPVHKVL